MSILNQSSAPEIIDRLNNLKPDTQPQWGKMNAAEMLLHCRKAIEIPLGKHQLNPNFFFKLFFGKWIKSAVVGDKPFQKDSPTSPDFLVNDKGLDFEKEKQALLADIHDFINISDDILDQRPHGLFGSMTAHEWRKGQWKHLDHHWRQFGK